MDESSSFGVGREVACGGVLERLDDGLLVVASVAYGEQVGGDRVSFPTAPRTAPRDPPPLVRQAQDEGTYGFSAAVVADDDGERGVELHHGEVVLVERAAGGEGTLVSWELGASRAEGGGGGG